MRLLLSILVLSLVSCAQYKEPEFIKLTNLKLKKLSAAQIKMEAELVYYNPNPIGVNVSTMDVDVLVNEIAVGKLKQIEEAEINGNEEFTLAVAAEFPLEKILKEKGLLGNALKVLLNEKAALEYKGKLIFDIGGIPISKTVDYKEEIPLKF